MTLRIEMEGHHIHLLLKKSRKEGGRKLWAKSGSLKFSSGSDYNLRLEYLPGIGDEHYIKDMQSAEVLGSNQYEQRQGVMRVGIQTNCMEPGSLS